MASEVEIKQLVKRAKKRRKNRVYYFHDFKSGPLTKFGIIRSEKKSQLDLVLLEESKNEAIKYCGFDPNGSYFELNLKISSLFADVQRPTMESRWRLAQVQLTYIDEVGKYRYSYKHQNLIDYDEKRRMLSSQQHEPKHVYRIGSLTLDIVVPFALSRIVFNGILRRQKIRHQGVESEEKADILSCKLSFSVHPTNDKFDYKYNFSSKYLSEVIGKSTTELNEAERLLDIALEDRIDQTIMLRGKLDILDSGIESDFLMWGLKSRRFIDPQKKLASSSIDQPIESLTIWTNVGHLIHLSRPVGSPSLVYGIVSCDFGFCSPLYAASCLVPNGLIETDFGRLTSFSKMAPGVKMTIRVFETKEIQIEIPDGIEQVSGQIQSSFRVKVNGFDGFGQTGYDNPGEQANHSQSLLWTLNIHDPQYTYKLSDENLLGGKGNSLVRLTKWLADHGKRTDQQIDPADNLGCSKVSVPRGLVVSSVAYQLWLDSNPLIGISIRELDVTRRSMSAKTYYTNPYSEKYLSLTQQQQVLKNQCQKTQSVLNSCFLPSALKKQLHAELSAIFGQSALEEPTGDEGETKEGSGDGSSQPKKFAVRSSAMGEDSLETSAAGQMKTILDACGFEMICRAIVSCWSSQFELEAVTYKTQNGLLFNWPMAVVIQELVECHSAGVAATCDPLSGDIKRLEITANLGLGEGVVGGKETDTIRVSLERLNWDDDKQEFNGLLKVKDTKAIFLKLVGGELNSDQSKCCMTDQQILALSNTLLWLRRRSEIKQCEVEWGISLSPNISDTFSESSSSSYCSTISSVSQLHSQDIPNHCKTREIQQFQLHLLQLRPLTNLLRLNNIEIYHELDCGIGSPNDLLSRANIGEVMPGALSPLALTYFMNYVRFLKDFPCPMKNRTMEPFSSGSFAYHSRALAIVITNPETLSRFKMSIQTVKNRNEVMIGFEANEILSSDLYMRLLEEKHQETSKSFSGQLFRLFLYDSGGAATANAIMRGTIKLDSLVASIPTIDELIEQIDNPNRQNQVKPSRNEEQRLNLSSLALSSSSSDELGDKVREGILTLFDRLQSSTDMISRAWQSHIRCTLVSIGLNKICMTLMEGQRHYKTERGDNQTERLNDFSILMRSGSGKTESGNISSVLDRLIESVCREGKLRQLQKMSCKELYDYFNSESNTSQCVKRYRQFIEKNGHRAYKEFDFAQLTWSDDPSSIIKSLEIRLKQQQKSTNSNKKNSSNEEDESKKIRLEYEKVVEKIQDYRGLLINYLLPRARNATVRREETKSFLIRVIDRYRKAFRHLGALLCLEGRLPNANLIYHLSIDELDQVVKLDDEHRVDLARYIYKARRRQQTSKVGDSIVYPKPTMKYSEINEFTDQIIEGKTPTLDFTINDQTPILDVTIDDQTPTYVEGAIRGITSCSGLVTARACVIKSLDEIDQLEPNDILITYSIDVSWTVYFFTLSGIVTEVGGIVSHGAVVAREYGIPTLCTAIGACSKFKTGNMITLDANNGIVYPAQMAKAPKIIELGAN